VGREVVKLVAASESCLALTHDGRVVNLDQKRIPLHCLVYDEEKRNSALRNTNNQEEEGEEFPSLVDQVTNCDAVAVCDGHTHSGRWALARTKNNNNNNNDSSSQWAYVVWCDADGDGLATRVSSDKTSAVSVYEWQKLPVRTTRNGAKPPTRVAYRRQFG
jgi:hypothetical protein